MYSLSNAEAALLGLLSENSMYAYQIEKEVQDRSMREWTDLSMSAIYKLLRKHEKQGLVSSTVEISDENRTRKTYQLTEEGREEFENNIRNILSEPENTKWRMDIGISNLHVLPIEEAVECLKTYKDKLIERLNGYKALDEYLTQAECPLYKHGLARRPIFLLQGEIDWIANYLNEMTGKEN